jgi:hypothetical protein
MTRWSGEIDTLVAWFMEKALAGLHCQIIQSTS